MKQVIRYEAFDGMPFATEAECRAYERKCAHIRLVGLSIEDVEAALTRADLDLAEAIEEVARRIKRIRLGKGAAPIEAEAAAADEERERVGDEARTDEAA